MITIVGKMDSFILPSIIILASAEEALCLPQMTIQGGI